MMGSVIISKVFICRQSTSVIGAHSLTVPLIQAVQSIGARRGLRVNNRVLSRVHVGGLCGVYGGVAEPAL